MVTKYSGGTPIRKDGKIYAILTRVKHFFFRILSLITGIIFYAIGIVITIKANIGYAPWDVFHVGLANSTGLSIGTMSIIVGIIIGIVVVIQGEKLGLGTILNMVFIGVFVDIIFSHIPLAKNFATGTIMLIAGLFVVSLGSYFYIKAAFGAGPRDSLMVVLARKTKFPVGLCRFALEFLVLLAGWLLGGMVGFGTVLAVIAIGFCIQLTFKVLKFDVTAVKHETLFDTFTALKTKR